MRGKNFVYRPFKIKILDHWIKMQKSTLPKFEISIFKFFLDSRKLRNRHINAGKNAKSAPQNH